MPRSLISSQRMLAFAVVTTAVASLLPPAALGWTNAPVRVFNLILTPFAVAGNQVSSWLKPAPLGFRQAELPATEGEYIKHLQGEMAKFERLYIAEQTKVESLVRQLEQLQKVKSPNARLVRPIIANVSLRSPSSPFGAVGLSRGATHGVRPGTIAVYEGVHLIGRVTEDISGVQCTMLPLSNPKTGLLDAVVLAKDRAGVTLTAAPKIQLTPRGDGTFSGQADRMALIHRDDDVVLIDTSWSPAAQGMNIGRVVSVQPSEMEPLRNTITVRPSFQISQLAHVMLDVEIDEAGEVAAAANVSGSIGGRR
ncbi:MAG: hypothetical protein L0Y44_10390 [Phycisphaerales bacterium]|nr:hypothetical protein [Phycisphaerales bacterium]MCI0631046.1 hypothetical protein [Phycisphaerales bacterium]MCI0677408.1 hypothetical protein [Phycisphaerales bacterium]